MVCVFILILIFIIQYPWSPLLHARVCECPVGGEEVEGDQRGGWVGFDFDIIGQQANLEAHGRAWFERERLERDRDLQGFAIGCRDRDGAAAG